MALPTFNSFEFNDENFITERITFKGFADRAVTRAKINRREGVKLVATEFGEKQVTLEGRVIADSSSELQSLLDGLKQSVQEEEGSLVLENGRTFLATISSIAIPDEHYNQSTAPWMVTFICSNPFANTNSQSVVIPVPSGVFTVSGLIVISGTFFNRPVLTFTPAGAASGNTLVKRLDIYHVPSAQTLTVSGFGSGTGLSYANAVVIDMDNFSVLEGTTDKDFSGSFMRWEPGTNRFTVTSSDKGFPGGTLTVTYNPRYL